MTPSGALFDEAPYDYSGTAAPRGFGLDGCVAPFPLCHALGPGLHCAIWVRICRSWLKRGFLLLLLTWKETLSAGQRSYYLCEKWAVKYMAHKLGQGLGSGNTDSCCARGFATNPKRRWLSGGRAVALWAPRITQERVQHLIPISAMAGRAW